MIEFSPNRPIFLQIADRLADAVLDGQYKADERVPSVREFSAQMGVNTGTCMKAYEHLSDAAIIYNRRGIGYYVAPDALERITASRREEFLHTTLPDLFRTMRQLSIDIDTIVAEWRKS